MSGAMYFGQTLKTIKSYEQASRLWESCRFKDKGKPVSNWMRMYKHDDQSIEFKLTNYGNESLAVLTPDNILTFTATPERVFQNAQTLVSSLHRWLPITMQRHRKGLYRVAHTEDVLKRVMAGKPHDTRWYFYPSYYTTMRKEASYFQGLQFNMLTGECLNRQPDDEFIEKPAERKVWRDALATFKRGIKARARVHALEGVIDKVWAERQGTNRWHWRQPDWSSTEWMALLESSIRDNKFSVELLEGFVQSTGDGYYVQHRPTSADVVKAVDKVCNQHSIELRRRFNVFEER